jgi:hypothetical protein
MNISMKTLIKTELVDLELSRFKGQNYFSPVPGHISETTQDPT